LYVVATPIGNLDDITLRAVRVLGEVDRVVAEDTRNSRRLLDHLGLAPPMLSLHEFNEDEAGARVLALLQAGESLALISDAGTPLISDPGFPLVRACRERAIEVVPVPGPSALIAALSVSGLPTDRFCFHGFLPRRQAARRALLESLTGEPATLVFYESSHRIAEALDDLVASFGGGRQALLARELTKLHETLISAPLAELAARVAADDNQRRGEIVLLVAGAPAPAADLDPDVDRLLRILLEDLPVKLAAQLAARISGGKKNACYQRALELAGD
jgi:16S rRNA (cytidine1402-2'-O)-methyltransferase